MPLVRVARLWRRGVPWTRILYNMSEGIRRDNGANILAAIDDWNDHTNVRLLPIERAGQTRVPIHPTEFGGLILFQRGERVRSSANVVGQQVRGINSLRVANASVQTIVHEIGHALGFYHEQQRMDRDAFTYIVEQQTSTRDFNNNYRIMFPPYAASYRIAYDANSIMHYPPQTITYLGQTFTYFDALPWRTPIGPVQRTLPDGSQTWLSPSDIRATNAAYPNPAPD